MKNISSYKAHRARVADNSATMLCHRFKYIASAVKKILTFTTVSFFPESNAAPRDVLKHMLIPVALYHAKT